MPGNPFHVLTEAPDVVDGSMMIASTLSTGSIDVASVESTSGTPFVSVEYNPAALLASLTVTSGARLSDDGSDSAESEYRSFETKDDNNGNELAKDGCKVSQINTKKGQCQ